MGWFSSKKRHPLSSTKSSKRATTISDAVCTASRYPTVLPSQNPSIRSRNEAPSLSVPRSILKRRNFSGPPRNLRATARQGSTSTGSTWRADLSDGSSRPIDVSDVHLAGGQSFASDSECASTQQKTFTRWINSLLAPSDAVIRLETDLCDGSRLIKLLRALCPTDASVPTSTEEKDLHMHKVNNVGNVLQFLRSHVQEPSFQDVGIEGVVDGDMKSILALLWMIIQSLHLSKIGDRQLLGSGSGYSSTAKDSGLACSSDTFTGCLFPGVQAAVDRRVSLMSKDSPGATNSKAMSIEPRERKGIEGVGRSSPGRGSCVVTTSRHESFHVGPGARLLMWCSEVLRPYADDIPLPLESFTRSFQNGLAFVALIHRFNPSLISFQVYKERAASNSEWPGILARSFCIAEKEMGLPALLDPEDVIYQPDEKSVMIYLSQFYFKMEGMLASTITCEGVMPPLLSVPFPRSEDELSPGWGLLNLRSDESCNSTAASSAGALRERSFRNSIVDSRMSLSPVSEWLQPTSQPTSPKPPAPGDTAETRSETGKTAPGHTCDRSESDVSPPQLTHLQGQLHRDLTPFRRNTLLEGEIGKELTRKEWSSEQVRVGVAPATIILDLDEFQRLCRTAASVLSQLHDEVDYLLHPQPRGKDGVAPGNILPASSLDTIDKKMSELECSTMQEIRHGVKRLKRSGEISVVHEKTFRALSQDFKRLVAKASRLGKVVDVFSSVRSEVEGELAVLESFLQTLDSHPADICREVGTSALAGRAQGLMDTIRSRILDPTGNLPPWMSEEQGSSAHELSDRCGRLVSVAGAAGCRIGHTLRKSSLMRRLAKCRRWIAGSRNALKSRSLPQFSMDKMQGFKSLVDEYVEWCDATDVKIKEFKDKYLEGTMLDAQEAVESLAKMVAVSPVALQSTLEIELSSLQKTRDVLQEECEQYLTGFGTFSNAKLSLIEVNEYLSTGTRIYERLKSLAKEVPDMLGATMGNTSGSTRNSSASPTSESPSMSSFVDVNSESAYLQLKKNLCQVMQDIKELEYEKEELLSKEEALRQFHDEMLVQHCDDTISLLARETKQFHLRRIAGDWDSLILRITLQKQFADEIYATWIKERHGSSLNEKHTSQAIETFLVGAAGVREAFQDIEMSSMARLRKHSKRLMDSIAANESNETDSVSKLVTVEGLNELHKKQEAAECACRELKELLETKLCSDEPYAKELQAFLRANRLFTRTVRSVWRRSDAHGSFAGVLSTINEQMACIKASFDQLIQTDKQVAERVSYLQETCRELESKRETKEARAKLFARLEGFAQNIHQFADEVENIRSLFDESKRDFRDLVSNLAQEKAGAVKGHQSLLESRLEDVQPFYSVLEKSLLPFLDHISEVTEGTGFEDVGALRREWNLSADRWSKLVDSVDQRQHSIELFERWISTDSELDLLQSQIKATKFRLAECESETDLLDHESSLRRLDASVGDVHQRMLDLFDDEGAQLLCQSHRERLEEKHGTITSIARELQNMVRARASEIKLANLLKNWRKDSERVMRKLKHLQDSVLASGVDTEDAFEKLASRQTNFEEILADIIESDYNSFQIRSADIVSSHSCDASMRSEVETMSDNLQELIQSLGGQLEGRLEEIERARSVKALQSSLRKRLRNLKVLLGDARDAHDLDTLGRIRAMVCEESTYVEDTEARHVKLLDSSPSLRSSLQDTMGQISAIKQTLEERSDGFKIESALRQVRLSLRRIESEIQQVSDSLPWFDHSKTHMMSDDDFDGLRSTISLQQQTFDEKMLEVKEIQIKVPRSVDKASDVQQVIARLQNKGEELGFRFRELRSSLSNAAGVRGLFNSIRLIRHDLSETETRFYRHQMTKSSLTPVETMLDDVGHRIDSLRSSHTAILESHVAAGSAMRDIERFRLDLAERVKCLSSERRWGDAERIFHSAADDVDAAIEVLRRKTSLGHSALDLEDLRSDVKSIGDRIDRLESVGPGNAALKGAPNHRSILSRYGQLVESLALVRDRCEALERRAEQDAKWRQFSSESELLEQTILKRAEKAKSLRIPDANSPVERFTDFLKEKKIVWEELETEVGEMRARLTVLDSKADSIVREAPDYRCVINSRRDTLETLWSLSSKRFRQAQCSLRDVENFLVCEAEIDRSRKECEEMLSLITVSGEEYLHGGDKGGFELDKLDMRLDQTDRMIVRCDIADEGLKRRLLKGSSKIRQFWMSIHELLSDSEVLARKSKLSGSFQNSYQHHNSGLITLTNSIRAFIGTPENTRLRDSDLENAEVLDKMSDFRTHVHETVTDLENGYSELRTISSRVLGDSLVDEGESQSVTRNMTCLEDAWGSLRELIQELESSLEYLSTIGDCHKKLRQLSSDVGVIEGKQAQLDVDRGVKFTEDYLSKLELELQSKSVGLSSLLSSFTNVVLLKRVEGCHPSNEDDFQRAHQVVVRRIDALESSLARSKSLLGQLTQLRQGNIEQIAKLSTLQEAASSRLIKLETDVPLTASHSEGEVMLTLAMKNHQMAKVELSCCRRSLLDARKGVSSIKESFPAKLWLPVKAEVDDVESKLEKVEETLELEVKAMGIARSILSHAGAASKVQSWISAAKGTMSGGQITEVSIVEVEKRVEAFSSTVSAFRSMSEEIKTSLSDRQPVHHPAAVDSQMTLVEHHRRRTDDTLGAWESLRSLVSVYKCKFDEAGKLRDFHVTADEAEHQISECRQRFLSMRLAQPVSLLPDLEYPKSKDIKDALKETELDSLHKYYQKGIQSRLDTLDSLMGSIADRDGFARLRRNELGSRLQELESLIGRQKKHISDGKKSAALDRMLAQATDVVKQGREFISDIRVSDVQHSSVATVQEQLELRFQSLAETFQSIITQHEGHSSTLSEGEKASAASKQAAVKHQWEDLEELYNFMRWEIENRKDSTGRMSACMSARSSASSFGSPSPGTLMRAAVASIEKQGSSGLAFAGSQSSERALPKDALSPTGIPVPGRLGRKSPSLASPTSPAEQRKPTLGRSRTVSMPPVDDARGPSSRSPAPSALRARQRSHGSPMSSIPNPKNLANRSPRIRSTLPPRQVTLSVDGSRSNEADACRNVPSDLSPGADAQRQQTVEVSPVSSERTTANRATVGIPETPRIESRIPLNPHVRGGKPQQRKSSGYGLSRVEPHLPPPPDPIKYVPVDRSDPIDVRVADIVNEFGLYIPLNRIAPGRYTFGGALDPKVCNLKLLRNRTVVVRVGGGWKELREFILTSDWMPHLLRESMMNGSLETSHRVGSGMLDPIVALPGHSG